MHRSHSSNTRTPNWSMLSRRFAEGRECLATFLALEAAAVLEGVKPALLVNIANRRRACGRNLYPLWQRFGKDLLRQSGLVARTLADRGDTVLLLIYHQPTLKRLLERKSVVGFLRKAGYNISEVVEATALIDQLAARFAESESFPHEIGVFLGYPLKDVAGFLGWGRLRPSGLGPWRFYGAPEPSVALAESFLRCRCEMAHRLANCRTPLACLRPPLVARRDCAA